MNAQDMNLMQVLGMQNEIVQKAIPDDERIWVPQASGVHFRPLMMNTVTGGLIYSVFEKAVCWRVIATQWRSMV